MMTKNNWFLRFKPTMTLILITIILCSSHLSIRSASANSVEYDRADVKLNGVIQAYNPAYIIDGAAMIPLRSIFEKIGATIQWDSATRTVTATKDVIIQLTIDNDTAYIDGQPIKLTSPPVIYNWSTLVPLRFITESLGAKVNWDSVTKTVSIQADGTVFAHISFYSQYHMDVAGGINIRYLNHTYSVRNQDQYNAVVKEAQALLSIVPTADVSRLNPRYGTYYLEYLDGARWDGNRTNSADRNVGLKFAEDDLSDLIKNGVAKEEILKIWTALQLADQLVKSGEEDKTNNDYVRSAYDVINGQYNQTARAQLYSAVFDFAGYNTAVVSKYGSRYTIMQIGDKWYSIYSGRIAETERPPGGMFVKMPDGSEEFADYYFYTPPIIDEN